MRRKTLGAAAVLLCAVMLISGCKKAEENGKIQQEDPPKIENTSVFYATVQQTYGSSVLVVPLAGEDELRSSDQITFSTKDLEDIGVCVGDIVKITYDGQIMESYPAQIKAISWELDQRPVPDSPWEAVEEKPVIYLYPEEETQVSVKLTTDGGLTCTYPAYGNGWNVTAAPDGTLTDANGQIYNYLYWEGRSSAQYDFSKGFCVKGEDTAAFLEDALGKLGLNRREANEFIVYWLPRMQENPYNIIAFQADAYTDAAPLDITPAPDSLIRVFMAYYPSETEITIAPQELTAPQRTGFTVIEWGGTEITQ